VSGAETGAWFRGNRDTTVEFEVIFGVGRGEREGVARGFCGEKGNSDGRMKRRV